MPCAALLCGALLLPRAGAGQSVLEWPLVLEARPGVLVAGAGAILMNPAGAGELGGRAEALVSDLETPDALALRALTIAGAVHVTGGWNLGIAYRHVGVGDMLRTDGPPIGQGPIALPSFEIAEDVYSAAVAYRSGAFAAGLAGRLDTPSDALGGDEGWAGTLGATWTPRVPLVGARLGATLEVDGDEPAFAAAAEAGSPPLLDQRLRLALGYGARIDSPLGTEHAVVGAGTWRGVAELQLGASAQPNADGHDWVPVIAGLVRIGRYHVGIVREHLPNGFGAAMHYRLSVVF